MAELAQEIARLADVGERLIEREERNEREQRHREREERWSSPQLTQGGIGRYLSAIPGLAGKFDRTVPGEFVAQSGDREVTIACPCRREPVLRAGELRGCECGRYFLYDGGEVHVALSPAGSAEPPPEPGEPAADDS